MIRRTDSPAALLYLATPIFLDQSIKQEPISAAIDSVKRKFRLKTGSSVWEIGIDKGLPESTSGE